MPAWVEPLCRIPEDLRSNDLSIRQAFERIPIDLSEPRFAEFVKAYLGRHGELIEAWQMFSDDNRGSPSHYLDRTRVGWFEVTADSTRSVDVRNHHNPVDACVDFIYRKATMILTARRVTGPPNRSS